MLDVVARKAEVVAWHEKLSPKEQREWAAPNTIKKHCPIFAKPKPDDDAEPKLTPAQQDRQALAAALEEIERLKKQRADERFTPTDTADNFTATKAEDIARRVLAKIKARNKGKATPNDKALTRARPAG